MTFETNDTASNLSIGQVEAQAERELSGLVAELYGKAPEETPAPTEAPPPSPTPEETQAPPQTEAAPTEQTAAPTPSELSVSQSAVTPQALESPEFKKALEIYGNDPASAAKGFLETNTRNAQLAAKLRELGIDPKTLEAVPGKVERETEQTAPALSDPKVVEGEVNRILDSDPVFVEYVREHLTNKRELDGLRQSEESLKAEIVEARAALKIPMIAQDSFHADQYQAKIQKAEDALFRLEAKRDRLESKQERLAEKADARANLAREHVRSAYQAEQAQRAEQAELQRLQSQAYAELSTSWPLALERAIRDHKIPAEFVEDFKESAKVAGLAFLQQSNEPINDVYSFIAYQGKEYMGKLDRYHRAMSATYGKLATQRTEAVTATPAVSAPAPQAPAATPQTEKSVYQLEKELEAEAAMVARQMGLFTR